MWYDWSGSSPRILKLTLNMHKVKRWLTPHAVWQTRISPRILQLRFNMHMVKNDLHPSVQYERPGSHLEFYS